MRPGQKPVRFQRIATVVALCGALVVAVRLLYAPGLEHAPSTDTRQAGAALDPTLVARGRELALLGHCAGCHTAPGGPAYAGGHALQTPFGTVYGGNLTPDPQTGLGAWTSEHFWQALNQGRSRDGRWLNPAFPYENFSHIRREDSDALFAYLQSLPPVQQANPAHRLRFPANTQIGLAVWRALYLRPEEPRAANEMTRGEYLVRGLAHCSACHASRNALGAQSATHDFSGQLMPGGRAYAPPLPPQGRHDAGPWTVDDLVTYLKTGHSRQGAALGLMADVVMGSTQHVEESTLREMATWILSRPQALGAPPPGAGTAAQRADGSSTNGGASSRSTPPVATPLMELGARVYSDHCASCHGDQGQGVQGLYPPLAGNPRVARDPATNLIRIIQEGGFGPATAGHPRPFGMPPFGHVLQPQEVAAVATFVRKQWNGANSTEVTALDVVKQR